ncbi:hypothetical protein SB49_14115 [Sediminicola sp. YIK13]|nr:hypothetical protein SB49_14115 [Sediminicola sp. YIK13]
MNYPPCLIIILMLVGCNQKSFHSENELTTYLQDEGNHYIQKKTINGVDFSISYRPTDLLVNQELGEVFSVSKVDSLREKYRKYLYFTLSMAKDDKELLNSQVGNKNKFGAMVNQLAFGMENSVHLISDQRDSIPLADYVYPRMYGMGGNTTILFVYPRNEKLLQSDYFNFIIKDIGFATGEVGFRMETKLIINEPSLNFKS